MDSALSAGIQGMKAGMNGVDQAAQNIAGVTARLLPLIVVAV